MKTSELYSTMPLAHLRDLLVFRGDHGVFLFYGLL